MMDTDGLWVVFVIFVAVFTLLGVLAPLLVS